MKVRTARDLPVGSTVVGGSSLTWEKTAEDVWVDGDGDRFTDLQIGVLLQSGGKVASAPSDRRQRLAGWEVRH